MHNIKFGLRTKELSILDWQHNGFTSLGSGSINPSGDWSNFLPVVEYQNINFEKMNCVTYSLLNCLEILHLYLTKKERNFSDRWLSYVSGTNKYGNYLETVFDTARNLGLVNESLWPDIGKTWGEYYIKPPQEIYDQAKKFLNDFTLYREWVKPYNKDDIKDALRYAPLQVTVRYAEGNTILKPTGSYNHAVTLYNVTDDYYDIFDHYTQSRKKYSIDYEFGLVLKPTLIINNNIPMSFVNNTLIFKTQGAGYNFAIYLDGKLLIGETADVIGSWLMRTNNLNNKKSITLEEWNKLPHYDLKGNVIS